MRLALTSPSKIAAAIALMSFAAAFQIERHARATEPEFYSCHQPLYNAELDRTPLEKLSIYGPADPVEKAITERLDACMSRAGFVVDVHLCAERTNDCYHRPWIDALTLITH